MSASSTTVGDKARYILIISEGRPAGTAPTRHNLLEPKRIQAASLNLSGRVPMKEMIRDSVDVIEKMCIEAALNQTKQQPRFCCGPVGPEPSEPLHQAKRYGLEDFGDDD